MAAYLSRAVVSQSLWSAASVYSCLERAVHPDRFLQPQRDLGLCQHWFLSPLYHLAEYSYKYRQDLLWKNKTILLMVGTAATVIGLWKTLRNLVQH